MSGGAKEDQLRGQLGQPLRQFSEVQSHLQKLRTNFDKIIGAELTIAEVYELAEKELLARSALEPHKPQKMPKVLKSAGSMLGGDEVDSECRTEDEEYASNNNKNDCNSIRSADQRPSGDAE